MFFDGGQTGTERKLEAFGAEVAVGGAAGFGVIILVVILCGPEFFCGLNRCNDLKAFFL